MPCDGDRQSRHLPEERAKGRRTREVVLLEPAIAALKSLPRHFKSPYVFWHRDGKKFRQMDRGLKAAAKRSGIKDLRWHDLRRTHGCLLLQEHNWSIEMVKDQLGHSTTAITQKAYAFLEVEQRLARAGFCAAGESDAPQPEAAESGKSSTNAKGTA